MHSRGEQLAWAAGLFEGEGCFTLARSKSSTGNAFGYGVARLGMTDEDVVRRFHLIVGLGSVFVVQRNPTASRRSTKPMWYWQVRNREGFEAFAALIEPWLGDRRRQKLAEVRNESSPSRRKPPQRERCKRGHLLRGNNRKPNGSKITCRRCAIERERARRARMA